MSHIYWELPEIPIPAAAHTNKSDGRVYLLGSRAGGKATAPRNVIGHATSETLMHPNTLFKSIYPELWKEHYGSDSLRKNEIDSGLYIIVLAILSKIGLLDILYQVYGPKFANAIIDFASYSIEYNSNVAMSFEERMKDFLLFSDKHFSDSWYSNLFSKEMSENKNIELRKNWLRHCAKNGTKKAWISIDGSNNECNVSSSNYVEKGHSKSGKEDNIISFIYAVDAESGTPLVYNVNPGGVVDCKALSRISRELEAAQIDIEGLILDRGFVSDTVISEIKRCEFEYVLMLKENTISHVEMVQKYQNIKWNMSNAIHREGTFGITEYRKIFNNSDTCGYINTYFNAINATERSVKFCCKILKSFDDLKKAITEGHVVSIPSELSKYIEIDVNDNEINIKFNDEGCKKIINSKGFYSIASSKDYGYEEVDRIYHLRDSSEKQYRTMKSQLGFSCTHSHSIESIKSRYAVCFIASIIRNEIQKTCQKFDIKTNDFIQKLDRVKFILSNDRYVPVLNLKKELLSVFEYYGVGEKRLVYFSDDYNNRLTNTIVSQVRSLPHPCSTRKNSEDDPNAVAENVHKSVGRPAGSKNRKTLLRESLLNTLSSVLFNKVIEELQSDETDVPQVTALVQELLLSRTPAPNAGRAGRKKGSLNKKTIAVRSALLKALVSILNMKKGTPLIAALQHTSSVQNTLPNAPIEPQVKRGRKKGSRNQRTVLRERLVTTFGAILLKQVEALKAQGAPTAEKAAVIASELFSPKRSQQTTHQKKRGGRKKGSRNRITIARENLVVTLASILVQRALQLHEQRDSEAKMALSAAQEVLTPKSLNTKMSTHKDGRGRKKGSRNKRTMERERLVSTLMQILEYRLDRGTPM